MMTVEEGRRPVLADVARVAGVSHQTVSRVVNGADHIRPATRDKVLAAIDELGYRPNTTARALVRGRSGIIGVVATAAVEFGTASIERTIELAASEAGFLATSVNLPELTPKAFARAAEHLRTLGVEAVVMVVGHDEALRLARAQTVGVPVVIAQGDLGEGAAGVGVDQVAGSRAATRHLLDLGHRAVVHVAGPLDWAEARARLEGWRATMHEAGLAAEDPLVGDWSSQSGYEAGLLLRDRPDVTGVVAANDQMALGVLRALHETGRRVPHDVSVVGFDDIPEAGYLLPPLTTVRQDFAAIGRRAVETVRHLVDGGSPEPAPLLVPELVVRESTAPPTRPRRTPA
ncbi:LacI family DNA-binding transcriptional regulator [Phycicoccus sp. BSK3Z-2]|uniref:LacI family DNA-binding transcriptional regulator n=1 Tax=Phycicoccus avicenniae TaxID=2828860 RepID=A0A941HYN4_9MICO|nr:LacI family DNA-binding transcriptional regulator [Phycicoccus avicenniae]MBR7742040.1 LacI family DNA-binding transcriptional regulator [Phycicoccus avicenniae]